MTQPPTPEQPTSPPGKPTGLIQLTPAPIRKKWPWIGGGLGVLAVIAVVTVVVTTGGETGAASMLKSWPPPQQIPAAAQVECVNIDRAYNAWDTSDRAKTAEQIAALNEFTIKWEMDDGKVFANQIGGYPDQPAKKLNVSVAEYNYQLSLANVSLTLGEAMDDDDAAAIAAAVVQMGIDYTAWKAATCGS